LTSFKEGVTLFFLVTDSRCARDSSFLIIAVSVASLLCMKQYAYLLGSGGLQSPLLCLAAAGLSMGTWYGFIGCFSPCLILVCNQASDTTGTPCFIAYAIFSGFASGVRTSRTVQVGLKLSSYVAPVEILSETGTLNRKG
jgi:hypothetical protein